MLAPKKVKWRKQQKGKMRGISKGATTLSFGDFGLQALSCGFVTSRQIEAARIAISRHVKRGGKLYIRIFPDKPISKKPAETRMGNGKGNPEEWVAVVRPGRVMYELEGVDETLARQAFHLAEHKLSVQTRFVVAGGAAVKGVRAKDLRGNDPERAAPHRAQAGGGSVQAPPQEEHQPAREHDADPQHAPRHRARQHRPRRALARRRRRTRGLTGRDGRSSGGQATKRAPTKKQTPGKEQET